MNKIIKILLIADSCFMFTTGLLALSVRLAPDLLKKPLGVTGK